MESKYLDFVDDSNSYKKRKTKTFLVNTKTSIWLGDIAWSTSWRRYVVAPDSDMVYDPSCLREIADFCEQQTNKKEN